MSEREVYRRLRIVIDEDDGHELPDSLLDAQMIAKLEATGILLDDGRVAILDTVEVVGDV